MIEIWKIVNRKSKNSFQNRKSWQSKIDFWNLYDQLGKI